MADKNIETDVSKRIARLRARQHELELIEEQAKSALLLASADVIDHRKILDKAIIEDVMPKLATMERAELDEYMAGMDKRSARALARLKDSMV